MKRFRQKRSSNDISSSSSQTGFSSPLPHNSETPLFFRPASSNSGKGRVSPTKSAVSGPMALAAKPSFTSNSRVSGGLYERGLKGHMKNASRSRSDLPQDHLAVLTSPPSRSHHQPGFPQSLNTPNEGQSELVSFSPLRSAGRVSAAKNDQGPEPSPNPPRIHEARLLAEDGDLLASLSFRADVSHVAPSGPWSPPTSSRDMSARLHEPMSEFSNGHPQPSEVRESFFVKQSSLSALKQNETTSTTLPTLPSPEIDRLSSSAAPLVQSRYDESPFSQPGSSSERGRLPEASLARPPLTSSHTLARKKYSLLAAFGLPSISTNADDIHTSVNTSPAMAASDDVQITFSENGPASLHGDVFSPNVQTRIHGSSSQPGLPQALGPSPPSPPSPSLKPTDEPSSINSQDDPSPAAGTAVIKGPEAYSQQSELSNLISVPAWNLGSQAYSPPKPPSIDFEHRAMPGIVGSHEDARLHDDKPSSSQEKTNSRSIDLPPVAPAIMSAGSRGRPPLTRETHASRVQSRDFYSNDPDHHRHNHHNRHPDRSREHPALRSSSEQLAPTHTADSDAIPAYKNGPVRGRPLIFAAMSGTSDIAAIGPELPPMENVAMEESSSRIKEQDDLHAPHWYPSPKSPPSKLPSHHELPGPMPSLIQPRTQSEHEAPARPKKLSKPNKDMVRNAEVARPRNGDVPTEAFTAVIHRPASDIASSRQHRHHHRENPSVPDAPSISPQLQPPISLRNSHHITNGERESHKRSTVSDPGVAKRRSRDGVKALTEKQLEKLQHRLSSSMNGAMHHGTNGMLQPPPAAPVRPSSQLLTPPTPPSPEEYAQARARRRGDRLQKSRPVLEDVIVAQSPEADIQAEDESMEEKDPVFYPLARHVADPMLLANLLCYMSFYEWCTLAFVSKETRTMMFEEKYLKEEILERYLRMVGYLRWTWSQPEPLALTLHDLCAYMRGVSVPTHQYSRVAEAYLQPQSTVEPRAVNDLTTSCRAYTRVVLRLRAQAEAEAAHNARVALSESPPPVWPTSQRGSMKSAPQSRAISRSSSRAPSPTSSFSHPHTFTSNRSAGTTNTFRSPLFRPRRAPLLQVFVPSPEGDWLSDASVMECENELRRAGVLHLMRAGDVVWDLAVGDEANVGRMVWDGSYLIDLDYTYSRVGDLPKYLPTLAFPPSYFHRVVRTMGTGNPIVHIDIAPWAEEIASNLQLLQDRMKTETPQGGHHTVVRWVHRSSFTIRPPPGAKYIRIPVPASSGPGPSRSGAWVIDSGWYGSVVVEAEGTNEGLADLQSRCKGAFPPRAAGWVPNPAQREEGRTVFRLLRERSRPGEIWLRIVHDKERIMPL